MCKDIEPVGDGEVGKAQLGKELAYDELGEAAVQIGQARQRPTNTRNRSRCSLGWPACQSQPSQEHQGAAVKSQRGGNVCGELRRIVLGVYDGREWSNAGPYELELARPCSDGRWDGGGVTETMNVKGDADARIIKFHYTLVYSDVRMCYKFFLRGVPNGQTCAKLNSSMVTSIEEVCTLLFY
ncbi:hypothetical protein F444_10561 [Phytophthora nicotianae P1976]|uniref:Uncharacterized protein n=1 Tax=Phytophthora nicotianae P1976 TaxID=1317066 RepID=A0A081A3N7_PHYNI|nr:hypothetical protein F444_10561 [Phytophthora nicotianae P1976]